jgi:hypothetical protein
MWHIRHRTKTNKKIYISNKNKNKKTNKQAKNRNKKDEQKERG